MKALERRLGLGSVIGISIGAMLGSGLFVLPGLAVLETGRSLWLAYLVAGLCVLPATLSKSELATAMPVSGGTYVYVDRTFGPLVSTIVGLGLWLSLLLKAAFALVGFGAYLSVLTDAPPRTVGLALLAGIAVLNMVGVRKVGKIQTWVVLVAMVALLLLALFGLGHMHPSGDAAFFSKGAGGFLATIAFVYISYDGVTKVAAVAEEVQSPARNLPAGMLLSLFLVTALYTFVTFVLVAVVPRDLLTNDAHPIYLLAGSIGGTGLALAAGVLGVVTMTSMANAGLLASSRFPFAMSRDNLMPEPLGYINPRFLTPVVAIIATALLMAAVIVFIDIESIAKFASCLMILGFTMENLSVLVLRESRTLWYQPAFRSPLYPLTQILGVAIGLALLIALGTKTLIALTAVILPGLGIFLFIGRRRTQRQGVVGQLGPRRERLAPSEAKATEAEHDQLPTHAAVVVPLDGSERSPEALVEIAGALADGAKIAVAHLTEVPEQLMLDADLEESLQLGSLRRRVRLLGEERRYDVELDALVTRDIVRTIHDVSRRVDCEWVVLDWKDRIDRGLLRFSPRGWLFDHLDCNLAVFKNAGVRFIREILVLAEPGPNDALVATTADHLAAVYGAQLTFVRFVHDDAPPMVHQAEVDYVEEIAKLCSTEPAYRVLRGKDSLDALTQLTAGYDLLVMGAPPARRVLDYARGTHADRLTRAAACSVLGLKPPRRLAHAAANKRSGGSTAERVSLTTYLTEGCLAAGVRESNKEALFQTFAEAFGASLMEAGSEEVVAALWERERTQNTAVDLGMALPHATLRSAGCAHLGIFTCAEPLDYKSPDGRPVDVFFVTLGPPSERDTHLRILVGLSDLVLNTSLLDDLRRATTPEELRAALLDAEARRVAVASPAPSPPARPH